MIAHIRSKDGKEQALHVHCQAVGELCRQSAAALHLSSLAQLIGLLHDMGKANPAFAAYLRGCCREPNRQPDNHPHHAATGASFARARWMTPGIPTNDFLTAQIIVLCIQGHHTGLPDCLSPEGEIAFFKQLEAESDPLNDVEAPKWFLAHVLSAEALDALFQKAVREIAAFRAVMTSESRYFDQGMLARVLLSFLVDADRWDSACFEHDQDSLSQPFCRPDWRALETRFDAYRSKHLKCDDSTINAIRSDISDRCHAFAAQAPGIFSLSVPTGGGKTLSSLRYALAHAGQWKKDRIFYIIPFNTILDQNAQDIRQALDGYDGILEHHANVVVEEDEQEQHRLLTERWDMPIILTSLVQFLNACFKHSNSSARRLYRLANAVLIFDEVQALPTYCISLFERAISFLTRCCGATVLLCTATQPTLTLSPPPREIMPDVGALYRTLERVRYFPDRRPRTNAQAAQALADLLMQQSVLAIVNTKEVAWDLSQRVQSLLRERGYRVIEADDDVPDDAEDTVLCVHLSTHLCPAHRLALLKAIKRRNLQKTRVFCVSTALIEAGINVSFPVVVRSLAGLPSIVQAAGRCNRSMEYEQGDVYLWNLAEEKLSLLPEIVNGKQCALQIIDRTPREQLGAPETIRAYFDDEACYIQAKKAYPCKEGYTLCDLLSKNEWCARRYHEKHDARPTQKMVRCQSFRTASKRFEVIPDQTRPILVPYGEGAQIIESLSATHTLQEEIALLRKAQMYSVSVYPHVLKKLEAAGALVSLGEIGVLTLKEGYYSSIGGLRLEREDWALMIY